MDKKTFRSLLKPVKELVPDAPDALAEVIHKCLEFEALKRPERVSEVQGALDHLVDELVQTPEDRLDAIEW